MTVAGGKGNTVHENNDLILQKAFQILSRTGHLFRSKPRAFSRKRLLSHGSVRHRKNNAFRILMGLETPDSGTIDGLKNLKISAVFQEDRLLEGYDVLTNLRFRCRRRLSDAELSAYCCSPFAAKCPVPAGM